MGENLLGKFATVGVIFGFIIFLVAFFFTMFGILIPEFANILFWMWTIGFIFTILGIVFGIVGIKKDDSGAMALRALIGGIIFFIVGILIIVIFNLVNN